MFSAADRSSFWGRLAMSALLVAAPAVAARGAEPANDQLPLSQVVLFNSGVGFFEHAGEVDGNAEINFRFNVDDINDLLKSLVPRDDGGQVSIVTYGSQDPITRTLKTFAIDLTENPTLADLLGQVRGERIELEAPNKITGTILGVEMRRERVEDQVVEVTYLNLLTDEGLQSLPLSGIARIRLLNAELDRELRQALLLLATARSNEKKTVGIRFSGGGQRAVRVGYVQEAPIWKTSYRLVMSDDAPPALQGWAIVENTTDDDWKNVRLTLVSGRPISFAMDLYQPLYVKRPVVVPELFASLLPQVYGQDLAKADANRMQNARRGAMGDSLVINGGALRLSGADSLARQQMFEQAAAPPGAAMAKRAADEKQLRDFALGVRSLAEATELGELFQYAINDPVDLPRQQSAMLPIVTGSVQGDKVSIYHPAVHAKHPLNGLKLVNSTGVHLMQGPITVFDQGSYAGDAQIEDLPPGAERLISYAVDLQTEVSSTTRSAPQELLSAKFSRGVLEISHKLERARTYTIKNAGDRTKTVLIEQPIDANWKLLTPEKPAEQTRDLYRFEVHAEPGKPINLKVIEQQTLRQTVAATNLDSNLIAVYLRAQVVSENVKEALREIVARKQALAVLVEQQRLLQSEVDTIGVEQARIRENMPNLDRNSAVFRRYEKKFSDQEDSIDQLRTRLAELQTQITEKRQALDQFLLDLNVE